MNSNNKDKGRTIKKAFLFSEEPTKKELCIAIFIHALMLALIVVSPFLLPLAPLIVVIGVLWFGRIVQKLAIELTDNSDRYIWQVINQILRRAKSSTINDALLGLLVWAVALLMSYGISILAIVTGLFWLLYVGIGGAIAVIVAFVVWHIWTIARQVKMQRRQEKTA